MTREAFEENVYDLIDRGFFSKVYLMQADIRQKIKKNMESK